MHSKKIIVWRFKDGKPGHEKQTLALVNILTDEFEVEVYDYSITHNVCFYLIKWLLNKVIGPSSAKKPDLIIGAGHTTHLPIYLSSKQNKAFRLNISNKTLKTTDYDKFNFKTTDKT